MELEEFTFSDKGRGRKNLPSGAIAMVRELLPSDIEAIRKLPSTTQQAPALSQIRHTHHQAAQLLAAGTPGVEVALITGYTPVHIGNLQKDPLFQELLAYYSGQRKQVFVDTLERMKNLGLSALDELQQRLAEAPEKWTNREMMEMAELLLVKSQAKGAGGPAGGGVSVNISFQSNKQQVIDAKVLADEA